MILEFKKKKNPIYDFIVGPVLDQRWPPIPDCRSNTGCNVMPTST